MIVGVGAGRTIEKVVASCAHLPPHIHIRCYTYPDTPAEGAAIEVLKTEHPEERLVRDLVSGVIDAAVRGSLGAQETLSALKHILQIDHLERIALLESPAGQKFLFAPVGVDEGWTIHEKMLFIEKARHIARRFGINENVAVLSGGRLGDVGRHREVDRTLAEGELLARVAGVDHAEILIEDAVVDHGIIIAPDGITGNLIFRTLVLLGGGIGHGAPVVNIDKIFVDTSRASPDYSNAILLAASLIK